jgi:glycerophosphoryl diester phosphodiesterase
MEQQGRRRPRVIAHRGFSGQYPENTIAAVEAAIELGVDMVEVDVRLSSDGVPVLCHNAQVNKTSDGAGDVATMTLDQLKALDVGSWKNARFQDERMPTLAEVLTIASGRTRLNLDIKDPAAVPAVLATLYAHDMLDEVVISGCTWRMVKEIRQVTPGVPVLLNVDMTVALLAYYGWKRTAFSLLLWQARFCGAAGINVVHRYVTPDGVARLHRANKPVWTWTVNTQQRALTLADMGVASITSNHPDRILAALTT